MASSNLEQFCSVTGAEEHIAQAYLSSCNNDIDSAVSLFMDNPSLFSETAPQPSSSVVTGEVRAPIPQVTEQLLPTMNHESFHINPEFRRRLGVRRAFVTPDDPEEGTTNGFSRDSGNNSSTDLPTNSSNNNSPLDPESLAKRNHLSNIFKPPTDLMFNGSIQEAKEAAKDQKKWLLISVHDDSCFDCHVLNRDVWKCYKVSSLVKKYFIFLQPLNESMDGFWYRSHYPYISNATHLSIMDPVTGSEKCMWTHLKEAEPIYDVLSDFVKHNPYPDDDTNASSSDEPGPSTSLKRNHSSAADENPTSVTHRSPFTKRSRYGDQSGSKGSLTNRMANVSFTDKPGLLDLSEEEQLRLAIEASKAQQSKTSTAKAIFELSDESDDEGERFIDSDAEVCISIDEDSQTESTPSQPSPDEDSDKPLDVRAKNLAEKMFPEKGSLNLMVRLPDGSRIRLSLDQSMHLKKLSDYFMKLGFRVGEMELLRVHPRLQLSLSEANNVNKTLEELGLRHQDLVHLQDI